VLTRTILAALILATATLLPSTHRVVAQPTQGNCGDPYAEVQISTAPRLSLMLARTEAEREQGLMYVTDLPPDTGMLFIYSSPASESYWMYHTLIPLSIAWMDRDGTILNIQDMPVLNDPNDVQEAARTVYGPNASYWYALEVNEGWFVQHGVGVGQQIAFCLN